MGALVRSIDYKGFMNRRLEIVESDNLLVIRTLYNISPEILLKKIPALIELIGHLERGDLFPEKSVFIFRIKNHPDPAGLRDQIKAHVRRAKHPAIRFIGSVMQFAHSGVYQIYTGNLFLKLRNEVAKTKHQELLDTYKLSKKAQLGFARHSYFVEAEPVVGRDIFALAGEIVADERVELCQPEMVAKRSTVRQLSYVNHQNAANGNRWIHELIGLQEAWKYTRGRGIKICVIDDGLDFYHPAFAGETILSYRDMLAKVEGRKPLHRHFEKHGTACAGIAVSRDNFAKGIAPDAQLIPIRSLGLGSVLEAEAFYWAVQQGADIISCSWGPPDGTLFASSGEEKIYPIPDHTDLAIKYASRKGRKGKGSLVFFAAGNGNEKVSKDQYASHPDVLAVGAINNKMERASYSDYEKPLFCVFPSGDNSRDHQNGSQSSGVLVPDRLGGPGYSRGDYYALFTGTSASCPGAAGIAALGLSIRPDLSSKEMKKYLRASCSLPKNYLEKAINGYHSELGYGILKADLLLKNIRTNTTITENNKVMKAKGISLHIGINNVSPNYYANYINPLSGCVNDMESMEQLAKAQDFSTSTLKNEQATRENILNFLSKAAADSEVGDIVLISYAGHGAPIRDDDFNEETDGWDEAWVTYDGFLLDDELYTAFKEFQEGVRVLLVSDSCHSGTMARGLISTEGFESQDENTNIRFVPSNIVDQVLKLHGKSRNGFSMSSRSLDFKDAKASILLLAACGDHQFAQEIDGNGVFTTRLLEEFHHINEVEAIDYNVLIERIKGHMPDDQIPSLKIEGNHSVKFDDQLPFSIDSTSEPIMKEVNDETDKSEAKVSSTAESPVEVNLLVDGTADRLLVSSAIANRSIKNLQDTILRVRNGEVPSGQIEGRTPWDKAYQLVQENAEADIDFVEPNLDSNDFELEKDRGSRKKKPSYNRLSTYPPEKFADIPFDWHLKNTHSQLRAAAEEVYPELIRGEKRADGRNYVKIAHIDTGILDGHPALPEDDSLNLADSKNFINKRIKPIDRDKLIALGEQQGHGNATLALLAGGKLSRSETDNRFSGYFGAIPYAEVITLRVSESVVIIHKAANRVAHAIEYAVRQGVEVISMSMAGIPSRRLAKAINMAYEAGVVVVSAAGNSWVKEAGLKEKLPDSVLYPARYERTIAVVGAAYDHKPYVWDLHNDGQGRAEGGKYMQMSYGPASTMRTAIAAYTPNVSWFSKMKDKKFQHFYTLNGGGTSSATPQVAAAAGLYIQKYRSQLDRIAGKDKWKKVELVRKALFSTANLEPKYKEYYGNGILQAYDALKVNPSSLTSEIKISKRATNKSGLFFALREGIYRRGANKKKEIIDEMMDTEIMQLMHKIPSLFSFTQLTKDDKLCEEEKSRFVSELKKSSLCSDFLKRNLVSYPDQKGARSFSSTSNALEDIILKDKGSIVRLSVNGVSGKVADFEAESYVDGTTDLVIDTLELEINGLSRSTGNTGMSIDTNAEVSGQDTVMLTETEYEDGIFYEWIFPEKEDVTATKARSIGNQTIREGAFFIDIQSEFTQKRGIRGIIKKTVRIIKWLKAKIDKRPNIIKLVLDRSADKKYRLMIYDLRSDSNTWSNAKDLDDSIWNRIQNDSKPVLTMFPGTFNTVEKNYTSFLANRDILPALKRKYCRYVVGLNHPTVVDGIVENAAQLHDMLKGKLKKKQCTAICKSRGGLVARYLFEHTWLTKSGQAITTAPLELNKLFMLGTPNEGTEMAHNDNWKTMLNLIANVLKISGGFAGTAFRLCMIFIKAIANEFVDLPGLNDQEISSKLLIMMNKDLSKKTNYYAVSGNYEPEGLIGNFLDDQFIDGEFHEDLKNDIVVAMKSTMFDLSIANEVLVKDNKLYLGEKDNLSHFEYTSQKVRETEGSSLSEGPVKSETVMKWLLERI